MSKEGKRTIIRGRNDNAGTPSNSNSRSEALEPSSLSTTTATTTTPLPLATTSATDNNGNAPSLSASTIKKKKNVQQSTAKTTTTTTIKALEPGATATHQGGLSGSSHGNNNNRSSSNTTKTMHAERTTTSTPRLVLGQRGESSSGAAEPAAVRTSMAAAVATKRTTNSGGGATTTKTVIQHRPTTASTATTTPTTTISGGAPQPLATAALQSKQVWENRRRHMSVPPSDLVSVTATPPMEPAPVQQQQQQPATVRTHQLSPQRSNPAVGAFAIDVPAPVYAMGDDDNDNDEWERFPEEEFQTGRGGTTAAHHHHTSAVLEADIRPATLPTLVSDDNQQEEQDAAKSRTRWYIGGALCLVVVIVIVVVIVVVAGGGRGGGGGGNGLPETVLAPTPAPTPSLWAECFTSHRRLITLLLGRVNYDEFIDVELCPGTTYQVTEVERTEPAGGIEPVFTVQSNMRLKCGENGNLNDECVVTGRSGGRVLLLHTWALIQAQKVDTAENVTIEGITFERGVDSLVEMTNGGDITFKNCLFRIYSGFTPIVLNFKRRENNPDQRLRVTFESCIFERLKYGPSKPFPLDEPHNYTGYVSTIFATNSLISLIVKGCTFRNNEVVDTQLPGHAIISLGAEVQVENTCFYSNTAGRSGSPIAYYGDGDAPVTILSNNYVESNSWNCDFVSKSAGLGNSISCEPITADASECLASVDNVVPVW